MKLTKQILKKMIKEQMEELYIDDSRSFKGLIRALEEEAGRNGNDMVL